MDFTKLQNESRLLIEAELIPLQGTRFQPTGFPDLDAAIYTLPGKEKTEMLLVESAQSVANRLEGTIWDESHQAVVTPLQGISYVVVKQADKIITTSLLEAHRLSSNYIINLKAKDRSFVEKLKKELDVRDDTPVDFQRLAQVLARYDINSLLHGIFIAEKDFAGGRFKLARAISGFIEARNVTRVMSGGVKNDRINPKGEAKERGGNVPYHRVEYTAEEIKAYFNLDLAQIRGYRLGQEVEDLLIAIALYKIQSFLERGLRLRTACDLEYTQLTVKRPEGFKLPELKTLEKALPSLVAAAKSVFADPPVTEVKYEASEAKSKA